MPRRSIKKKKGLPDPKVQTPGCKAKAAQFALAYVDPHILRQFEKVKITRKPHTFCHVCDANPVHGVQIEHDAHNQCSLYRRHMAFLVKLYVPEPSCLCKELIPNPTRVPVVEPVLHGITTVLYIPNVSLELDLPRISFHHLWLI